MKVAAVIQSVAFRLVHERKRRRELQRFCAIRGRDIILLKARIDFAAQGVSHRRAVGRNGRVQQRQRVTGLVLVEQLMDVFVQCLIRRRRLGNCNAGMKREQIRARDGYDCGETPTPLTHARVPTSSGTARCAVIC